MTQGATDKGDELGSGAWRAIDKDLSTTSRTQTADGTGWFKIEFDSVNFIHKVIIYSRFYTDWFKRISCSKSVSGFENCVDDINNVDVSVYKGEVKQKSCGTLQLTYGLEQSDQIYTLICNIEGDNVKLSKSTGRIMVYEIIVTGIGN